MMKIIMVKNGKGGDGKTIFSETLSAMYAKKGKVLHIDTDVRCHSTKFFMKTMEESPKGSLGAWLMGSIKDDDVIIKSSFKNIDFICCSDDIEDYAKDIERDRFSNPSAKLKKRLDQLKGQYDYCIIDCSQNADIIAVNTFVASDFVLIPVKCSELSMNGAEDMIKWISQIKEVNPSIDYRIVINDKERNKEADQQVQKYIDLAENKLCRTVIRHQSKPLSASIRTGIPIVYKKRTESELKKKSIVDDFEDLWKELNSYGI